MSVYVYVRVYMSKQHVRVENAVVNYLSNFTLELRLQSRYLTISSPLMPMESSDPSCTFRLRLRVLHALGLEAGYQSERPLLSISGALTGALCQVFP